MSGLANGQAAVEATVVFPNHFKDLTDPRPTSTMKYPPEGVVLLRLLAVLAGAECFTKITRFRTQNHALRWRIRPFRDSTALHDPFGDILGCGGSQDIPTLLCHPAAGLTGTIAGVIAIDGKSSRPPGQKGGNDAILIVSASAAHQCIVLG